MTKNLPRSQYYTRQLHAEYLGKESYSTTSQCFPVWKLERHGDNVEPYLGDEDQSGHGDVEFREDIKPEGLIVFSKYLRDYLIKIALIMIWHVSKV